MIMTLNCGAKYNDPAIVDAIAKSINGLEGAEGPDGKESTAPTTAQDRVHATEEEEVEEEEEFGCESWVECVSQVV